MSVADTAEGRPIDRHDPDDQRLDVAVRRPTTHVVSFRLNSSEMELLEAAADESGLKLSQYIRQVLFATTNSPPADSIDFYPGRAQTFHWHSPTTPDARSRIEPIEPAQSVEGFEPRFGMTA
jgi:hypothetical protein